MDRIEARQNGFDLAYTVMSPAVMVLWNACPTQERYKVIREQWTETVEISEDLLDRRADAGGTESGLATVLL